MCKEEIGLLLHKVLIGSRSKLCNLIIQQALLVKYRININNLDYIQYNMLQSQWTVTDFGLVQWVKTIEQLKRVKQLD